MAFQFGFRDDDDDDDDVGSRVGVDSTARSSTPTSSDVLIPAQEITLQELVGKRCRVNALSGYQNITGVRLRVLYDDIADALCGS